MTKALALAAVLLSLSAFPYEYEPREDTFTNRLFLAITNGVTDGHFLTVDFATGNVPPPYLVGLFDGLDAQFPPSPTSRLRPLRHKVVHGRRATLACDARHLPHVAFVQVLPVSWTNAPGFRAMTPAEVAARHDFALRESARPSVPFRREDVEWTWPACSVWEGCSQPVPVFRPFRSLSARGDGLLIGLDWLGLPRFGEAPTNTVPGRIYWEGMR